MLQANVDLCKKGIELPQILDVDNLFTRLPFADGFHGLAELFFSQIYNRLAHAAPPL